MFIYAETVQQTMKRVVELQVNPQLYSKEIIYAATYVFLNDAYFMLEGDPEQQITIKIIEKAGKDPEEVKHELMNEMINYASYFTKLRENKDVMKMILEKAMFSASPALVEQAEEQEIQELLKELDDEESQELKKTLEELDHDTKKSERLPDTV